MKTTAYVRNIPVSYRKANLVCGLIRNKKVADALTILEHTSQKTAKFLLKLLSSAIANATNNHSMVAENLYVYEVMVGQGKTNKRAMPRAKGSSNVIKKRHSHLIITLSDDKDQRKKDLAEIKAKKQLAVKSNKKAATKKEEKPAKKPASKKTETKKGAK